jgi:hypothetical protein
VRSLTLVYDDGCGACRRWALWTRQQHAALPLRTLPARSGEGLRLRPPAPGPVEAHLEPLAIDDAGRLWRGPNALRMGLWALREHRHRSLKPGCTAEAMAEHDRVVKALEQHTSWRRTTPPRPLAADAAPWTAPPPPPAGQGLFMTFLDLVKVVVVVPLLFVGGFALLAAIVAIVSYTHPFHGLLLIVGSLLLFALLLRTIRGPRPRSPS